MRLHLQSVAAQAEHAWHVSVSRRDARANYLNATIVVVARSDVDTRLQVCQKQSSR
jgi:hypothetical protein